MFQEMSPEDKKYLEEILTLFKVSKYKMSETQSRFKLIIHPDEFNLSTLHEVQDIRTPVGIEIDLKNGVFLECLKSGASRKRRKLTLDVFKGDIPKKYQCGSFDPVIRVILGIEDICEFQAKLEDKKLLLKNIECLSYPVLKQIEREGFDLYFNMPKACITVTRAKLM